MSSAFVGIPTVELKVHVISMSLGVLMLMISQPPHPEEDSLMI